jgi:hypothetical protein
MLLHGLSNHCQPFTALEQKCLISRTYKDLTSYANALRFQSGDEMVLFITMVQKSVRLGALKRD